MVASKVAAASVQCSGIVGSCTGSI